jgi:hypothetical protein
MQFNWSILAWIAALIFVYIFGLLEGRGQGYKKRKAEEPLEEKKKEPEAHPATVTTVKVDDPGLLRIKNESGYITLDLDGSRVDTAALTNDQRKRLIEMLNLMRPWLEGKSVAAPASTPPPAAVPVPTPPQHQPSPVTSTPSAPPPIPQPTGPRPTTIAKEDRPSAPTGSIVHQIDAILQTRIAGTPLEDRGVFLTQSPEGGVIVYVGLTKYMGVDSVPDPEIKAAIRAAISEWENKYTPGI